MAPISKKAQKQSKKYTLEVTANSESEIVDVAALEKYLTEHIKIDNRTGNLQDQIVISRQGNEITIVSRAKFSGKYLKYLTKKFLKKNSLRDWIRVVAATKGVYQLKFFNVTLSDDEAEEEDEDEE